MCGVSARIAENGENARKTASHLTSAAIFIFDWQSGTWHLAAKRVPRVFQEPTAPTRLAIETATRRESPFRISNDVSVRRHFHETSQHFRKVRGDGEFHFEVSRTEMAINLSLYSYVFMSKRICSWIAELLSFLNISTSCAYHWTVMQDSTA